LKTVPENLQPESMTTWMRDVERRLRAVESAPKLLTQQYGSVRKQSDAAVNVTSSTFIPVWEIGLSEVVNDALFAQIVAVTSVGTVGEIRLKNFIGITPVTDAATIPSGLQRTAQFAWLPPLLNIGDTGRLIQVEARRVSGAGSMDVYYPDSFMQLSGFSVDANATGNVQVF